MFWEAAIQPTTEDKKCTYDIVPSDLTNGIIRSLGIQNRVRLRWMDGQTDG